MIRIADRHIGRTTLGGIALALFLLLALDAFFTFIREVGDVGKGDYGLGHVLWYIALTMPRRAYELFPTAAVVGAMLGVGGLAASSELIAYRAAGMSRFRIAMAVVMAASLVLGPILIMGEWVVPAGERMGQVVRVKAQSGGAAIARDSGLWVRDGDTIINARKPLVSSVSPGDFVKLAEIEVFEFEGDELRNVSHAEFGEHDGEAWTLSSVSRSRFEQGRVLTETAETEVWPSLLDPSMLQNAVTRPKYLSLGELFPYVRYLRDNGLNAAAYEAAIWWRISYPLSTLVVVFAGMPFVFGTLRTGGLGQRLFIGMMLGVGFYLATRTASNLGQVYELNPAVTALAPSLLLLSGSLWVLRRN
jgi:lipopolysaccharide export system permease protein